MAVFERAFILLLCLALAACGLQSSAGSPSASAEIQPTVAPTQAPTDVPVQPAFESGVYRNLFRDYLGKSDAEIQAKLDAAWNQLFHGDDNFQRVYYPVGGDMAYIEDIGNSDVRSEGMSYGMMIAVQLDKKEEFDRLWKWAKTYMYHADGPYKGYFAWHCKTTGEKLAANNASDGEVWFITALFFADARWGSGEGIYNYRAEAQAILDTALHADQLSGDMAANLFDVQTRQVVFVAMIGKNSTFTDPSYHMPHYYELWARWADKDNQFWAEAARNSREFLKAAANPQTGLMPDYANFNGTPYGTDEHKDFRFDAWRTLSNVAVDYAWFAADPWNVEQSNRVLDFLAAQGIDAYPNQFSLDGMPLSTGRSTGLISMAAAAALAANPVKGKPFVQELWDTKIPSGQWRYYDGMLYMLALLQVSGNFRIYTPAGISK